MTPLSAEPGLLRGALGGVIVAVIAITALALAFAAVAAVLRLRNDRAAARWSRLEAIWEPLILDVLVGERPPAVLHDAVAVPDRLYFVEYLVRFARRFRGEERALLTELARPYLHLIEPRVRAEDAGVRARAVQTLGTLSLQEHERAVLAGLDDPSGLVAMTALRMLARKEHPRYALHVLSRLERFEALSRRFLAAMVADMGPAVAPALRGMLADTAEGERVRSVAAEALALLGDADAGSPAAAVVASGAGRDLHASALRLLARVGTEEHADAARLAAASPEPVTRAHGMSALGRLGDAGDLARLRAGLEDPDPWVVIRAAYALAELGGGELLRAAAAGGDARALVAREVLESPAA